VEAALGVLDGDHSANPLVLPTDAWDAIADWPDDFLAALAQLTHARDDQPLLSAMRSLGTIKVATGTSRRLRPWLQLWKAHDQLLEDLEEVARQYLTAFGADSPLIAQRAAQQAQSALDRASSRMGAFNEERSRQQRVEAAGTPEEAAAVLVGETLLATGAKNILEFDKAGQAAYRRITGSSVCPPGIGTALQISIAQVLPLVDEDEFWRVVEGTWQVVDERRDRFRTAVQSSQWLNDFRSATGRAHDVAAVYGSALASAARPRHAARAMLDLTHGLIEGSAKRHLATLLSCVLPRKRYEHLRSQDVGGMLNTAGQQSLSHLLGGVDRTIRIAKAHEEWDVDGDVVILRSRETTLKMDMEELADKMLTALESVVAMSTGITLAAATEGVPLEQLHPIENLDVEWDAAIAITLAFAGWADVEVDGENDSLHVMAVAPDPGVLAEPLRSVVMTAPHVPPRFNRALFEVDDRDGRTLTIEGPMEPMRRWSSSEEGLTKDALFWEVAHSWTVDGVPRLSLDHVRKCAANAASATLNLDLREAVQNLGILRGLAQRIGDDELDLALRRLMGSMRNRLLELPQDRAAQDAVERLLEWQAARLPRA
jgi:hypothetical protein